MRLPFLFLFLISCGKSGSESDSDASGVVDNVNSEGAQRGIPMYSCFDNATLNYENFGEMFMLSHCTTCHSSDLVEEDRLGAPKNMDFDTPMGVLKWRSSILSAAGNGLATMPPDGSVSDEDRSLLRKWLTCGKIMGQDKIE